MKGWIALAGIALCMGAARGTLDGLADRLAARIAPSRGDDVAVAIDAPVPRLAADLTQLLVGRLLAAGARSAAPLELAPAASDAVAAAAARKGGFEELVRVRLSALDGRLRAEGSVLDVPGDLWSDQPTARTHLYAEAALDDELAAYLPAPKRAKPAAGWRTRSLAIGDVDLLALAIGDTDGDGRAELAGATAEQAIVWRLDGDRPVETLRVGLAGALAPVRPRADLATLRIEGGALEAHASPFESGVRRAGASTTALSGYPLPGLPGGCALAPGYDWFTAASCGSLAPLLPARFYSAVGRAQGGATIVAAIEPPPAGGSAGTLFIAGSAAPIEVKGVGAQVALAALDRESGGEVVVTTEPSEPGEPDAIVVRALLPGAPILHRVEGLPGEVRALAAGDLDGDGYDEIVAAVRDARDRRTELWILD